MKKIVIILIVVLFILVLSIGVLATYVFNWFDFDGADNSAQRNVLKNPVDGLTDEQAVEQFNEGFVYYLLVSIKAYELHNPPFSSNTPKIEIFIDNEAYNAEINKGIINVNKEEISGEDIVIKTSKAEAVKMLRDKNYVNESFSSGNSVIELVGSRTELASKGYLFLYEELS